jgi:hypothetical protein
MEPGSHEGAEARFEGSFGAMPDFNAAELAASGTLRSLKVYHREAPPPGVSQTQSRLAMPVCRDFFQMEPGGCEPH